MIIHGLNFRGVYRSIIMMKTAKPILEIRQKNFSIKDSILKM